MSKTRVDFDKYTSAYSKLLREKTKFFSRSDDYFSQYKVSILKDLVQGDLKSLHEFGCGIGRNFPYISKAFPNTEISGSDISDASIQIAKINNPNVKFINECQISKNCNLYDLIFVAGVFHHIPIDERLNVMKSLYKKVNVGGSIVIFEHNPFNPITKRIVRDCPYDADALLLKPKELIHYVSSSGFHFESFEYCLFFPPFMRIGMNIERMLGKIPLGGQYWVKAVRI